MIRVLAMNHLLAVSFYSILSAVSTDYVYSTIVPYT